MDENIEENFSIEQSESDKPRVNSLASKSRKNSKRHKRKIGVYYSLLTVVLLFCLVQVGFGAILNVSKIIAYKAKINTMERVRDEAENRNRELKSDIKQFSRTSSLEEIARNNLKMAGEDEVLVLINNPNVQNQKDKKIKKNGAIMQENNDVVDYIKRAFELKSQECYKQSIEMLYKALEIENDNNEILYQIGEAYFCLHNYDRAVQYIDKVLLNDNNHIPALKLKFNVYKRQNSYAEALESALKIYEIEENSSNLRQLISILGKLNRLDEIEKYIGKMDESCLAEYALACYQNGKFERAKDIILNSGFENDDCRVLLGKIYFDENNFEKSMENLENIVTELEKGELNLEESVKKFEQGINISKKCNDILEKAEKKITILLRQEDEIKEENFEAEEK